MASGALFCYNEMTMKFKLLIILLVVGLLTSGCLWSKKPIVPPPPPPLPVTAAIPDLITVSQPVINQTVTSPLTITGEARGKWYFEASFPVILLDANNQELAKGVAEAQGGWMTENFVPFSVNLTFSPPATPTGQLILKKDNPSGLPANDAQLMVPVNF